MNLTIGLEREEDGRWIAEAMELPGVVCYGNDPGRGDLHTERLARGYRGPHCARRIAGIGAKRFVRYSR